PEVHGLVELAGLGLPVAHVARVLLAARQHALGEVQPLAEPADLCAVPAQLVEVAAIRRRLEGGHRGEDPVLLGHEQRANLWHVALGPLLVLGQLAAQPLALVQVGIGPEVDVLVQHAELRRPAALELAVLVSADLAAHLGVELQILTLLARLERVRAQLVDHRGLLCRVTDTAPGACRLRSPCAADDPPSPGRGGSAADPGGPRTPPRACRSTPAPSSRRRGRRRSASDSASRRAAGGSGWSPRRTPRGCRAGPGPPAPAPSSPLRSAS